MSAPRLVGLRIDIETKSSTPVKFGSYVYAEDPDFEVLVNCYAPIRQYAGGARALGKPRALDLGDRAEVARFQKLLADPTIIKTAFNANFERVCLSRWMGMEPGDYLDPVNWHCSAVGANVAGVFGTLDEVARAVRSPLSKDTQGKALIKFFSIPMGARDQKTADANCGCQRFHDPAVHPDKYEAFVTYCCGDVMAEAGVAALLPAPSPEVQAEYEADQRINDRGFRHYKRLAVVAVKAVSEEKDRVMGELAELTGLDNPNSGKQMSEWLNRQGYPMVSLDKAHREEALADPLVPEEVSEVLTLKGQASLSSVAKHQAALDTRCADGRIRGSLRYYGAHTGREAGRGIQPQNLPKYEAPKADVKQLLDWFANERAGRAAVLPQNAPLIAKGSVRGSIVPARDHVFVTCDYNAIEARVLGGLAGETAVIDEFMGSGNFYERVATMMFGVDYDEMVASLKACRKCGACNYCAIRAKAKVAALALGYAGGAGALVTMGAEGAGIDVGNYPELNAEWKALGMPGKFHMWEEARHDYPELKRLRDLYRDGSPMTTRFWKLCAKAWDIAAAGKSARFGSDQCLRMVRDGKHNRVILPSGRSIWYRYAIAHTDPERPDRIDRRTFIGKGKGIGHMRTDTHGGKLTENITQAVARDLLFDLIMRIEAQTAAGWPARIVLHVHDEVVLEVPSTHADQVLADTLGLMGSAPKWATSIPVRGEGKIMERYGK